jgi:hypothetical protein
LQRRGSNRFRLTGETSVRLSSLRGTFVVLAALLVPLGSVARDAVPTVTLTEGPSTLISGVRAYVPERGVRLRQCDIVRTGPAAMVQIEFDDGGKIELGPDSRFLADLPASAAGAFVGPQFLLSGWAKVTVPKRDKAAPHRINTPHFDILVDDGVAVVRIIPDAGQFFVESGSVVALEPTGPASTRVAVSAGSTYSRKAAEKGNVASRVDAAFVQAMPRSYRDTLPALLPKVGTRAVQAKPAPEASFADVEDWLKSDPELRRCLVAVMVRSAQETLTRKGFDVGPIDGVLGPRTAAALREFQDQQGLARSGQLDEQTLKALDVADRR